MKRLLGKLVLSMQPHLVFYGCVETQEPEI